MVLSYYYCIPQMSMAVKKILYAADARESALAEAQEVLSHSVDGSKSWIGIW